MSPQFHILLIALLGFTQVQATENTYTLQGLTETALKNSPFLKQSQSLWRAELHKIKHVKRLPDPKIQVSYFLDEVETRVGPQEGALGITQSIPWLTKLGLQKDFQSQKAKASFQSFEAKKLQIKNKITKLYLQDRYLLSAIKTNQDNRQILKSIEPLIRQKIRLGANAQDLIKVQIELAKISEKISLLKKQRKIINTQLVQIINPQSKSPIKLNHQSLINAQFPDEKQLLKLSQNKNPWLIRQNELLKQSSKQKELANEAVMPDFSIGLKTIFTGKSSSNVNDNGKDPIIITFGFSIPLDQSKYNYQKAHIAEQHQASYWAKVDLTNQIHSSIRQSLFQIEDLDRNIKLYSKTLLPKVTESIQLSQQSYRNNKSSFIDILDLIRQNLAFSLQIEKDRYDRLTHIAELEKFSASTFISTSLKTEQK